MPRSIHFKTVASQLLLVLTAILAMGLVVFFTIIPYIRHIQQEKSEFIAATWAKEIKRLLDERKELLATISHAAIIGEYPHNFGAGPPSHYPSTFDQKFSVIAYLNEAGIEEVKIVNGKKVAGGKFHHSEAIQRARLTPNAPVVELISSPPQPPSSAELELPYLEFAFYGRLYGETNGLLIAQIPINQSVRQFADFAAFRFEHSGFLTLFDSQGTTIFHHDPHYILSNNILPTKLAEMIGAEGGNGGFLRNRVNGMDGFSAYAPVHGTGMIVSAFLPYPEFQQTTHRLQLLFIILGLGIILVYVLLSQVIKASHLELDQIFNNAAGGKLVINLSHEITRVNDTFLAMMGFKRQEVLGRQCHDLFKDKYCGTDKCVMEQVLAANHKVVQEVKKSRSDGSFMICTLVAVPFYGANGNLAGIIEDFRDITRTKTTEDLLKMSESRYRLLFDSAPDGIAVLNDQGVIIDCNSSLAEIYRRPRTGLIGHHLSRFHSPDSIQSCHCNFEEIKANNLAEGEVDIITPDDEIITIWRKGATIRDNYGYFTGVLIYDRDISKQKETEELREDMARIARHDLKTPLNGIINLPPLIKQDKNLNKTQIKRLNLIEDAGYKMLQMINNSLDLYKMEQGSYSFSPVSVNLCTIITKVQEELWPAMQSNHNTMTVLLNNQPAHEQSSFLIQGDELLCYSMLANLLKNAVESSPKAKAITVSLEKNHEALIRIHNHGQVSPEIRAGFFKKYVTAGKPGGTGLGTYSARLMARTQGGEIGMQSSSQEGTTITITMPTSPEGGSHDPAAPSTPAQGKETPVSHQPKSTYRILLVEDDPINQALIQALLQEKKGMVVIPVDNGRKAIEILEKDAFDLILMDMQMPEINGLEATASIRRRERALKLREIPIIAITGMVGEKQREKSYAAGVNEFVGKPIKVDRLWQAMGQYLDLD